MVQEGLNPGGWLGLGPCTLQTPVWRLSGHIAYPGGRRDQPFGSNPIIYGCCGQQWDRAFLSGSLPVAGRRAGRFTASSLVHPCVSAQNAKKSVFAGPNHSMNKGSVSGSVCSSGTSVLQEQGSGVCGGHNVCSPFHSMSDESVLCLAELCWWAWHRWVWCLPSRGSVGGRMGVRDLQCMPISLCRWTHDWLSCLPRDAHAPPGCRESIQGHARRCAGGLLQLMQQHAAHP